MTSFIMSIWICVLALMLTSQSCHGESVLTFSATPKSIKQNLTRTVTMRCEVAVNQAVHRQGSTDKDIESVANYWVTYGEDEYVASVEGSDKAKGFIDEGNLRVSGSASGMGYLELTWVQPAAMRLGTYKCHVNAKSKTNKFVSLKKSLQLTSDELSVTDLLERINKNEKDRKDADTKQLQRINQNEQDRIDEDKKHDEADKKQVSMVRCLSQKTAFMATLKTVNAYVGVTGGQTVVFDKAITNVGGAYDPNTGRYTAKIKGVYAFSVNAFAWHSGNDVNLNIKVNNEIITSQVAFNFDQAFGASGSARAVVVLDVGDVVTVEADDAFSRHALFQQRSNFINTNTFSGELLYPDCTQ